MTVSATLNVERSVASRCAMIFASVLALHVVFSAAAARLAGPSTENETVATVDKSTGEANLASARSESTKALIVAVVAMEASVRSKVCVELAD